MIKNKSIEHLDQSNVKLSVTLTKEASAKGYQDLIKEYSKKVQIPGFRPGKVPVNVLETKFGEGLRQEAAQNLVEESLKSLFEEIEEKPLPYAQPSLEEEIKFVPGEEFTFVVKYDVFPKLVLKDYNGLTVNQAQVSIDKEDLEKELKQLQDQNAIVSESDGPVADTDMVTVTYFEVGEDGQEVADTKREDFQFTVGQNANYYLVDDDVKKMKKGETKIVTKKYDDQATPGLAGRTIKLSISITRLRKKELPALDDELAQDIDEKYKTLDDLKKDIKARLEKTAASRIRQQTVENLINQIVEKHPFAVPESMVNAELYNKYEHMVRQFGGREATLLQLLQAQGSSVENLIKEWKPATEKDIRAQIVIRELVKAEKIEVSDADVDAEIKVQAESSKTSVEETREYFEKNGIMDQLKHHVEENKLFDKLLAAATIKKGDKVKYVDLMANNS